MARTKQQRTEADEKYFQHVKSIGQQLETIKRLIAEDISESGPPRGRNWAHVGSVAHVSEQLQEVIDFLS